VIDLPLASVFLNPSFAGAIAVTLAAGLMRGFTGFGAPLLLAPVLSVLYGPLVAVPVIVLMETPVSFQMVNRKILDAVDWRLIGPMAVGGLAFTPFGAWLLVWFSPEFLKTFIAVVMTGVVTLLLLGWRYRGPKPWWATAFVGILSGLFKGSTSFGGPPVLLYLLSGPEAAVHHRSNLILYIALMNAVALPSMWFAGVLSVQTFWLSLGLLPFLTVSAWAGSRLFRHANDQLYRRIALGVLLVVGIGTLLL
jgi:uncharacterized membrane protein YfcA